jgi:glycosyltransferase involved in cell wall biosynthesis
VNSASDSRNSSQTEDFSSSHLLVLNYVMDRTHPALAHQVDVVEGLAKYFASVTVLTGTSNYKPLPGNISVISTNWIPGKNIGNILRFYYHFFSVIERRKFSSVFSHMTLVQSSLIAPILRILQIKHFLWYAHAKNSIYLGWVYFWCQGVLTSTRGSCPINGRRVTYLGQSIEPNLFKENAICRFPLQKFVHIGRQDPSKNLELIIQVAAKLRVRYPALSLELVGNPLGPESEAYLSNIKSTWGKELEEGWLTIESAVPREMIPEILMRNDLFVHAFMGSLDKSLIEATMTTIPVVTLNHEYIREFGSWSKDSYSLESELESVLNLNAQEVFDVTRERRLRAIANHSFSKWILSLTKILQGEQI